MTGENELVRYDRNSKHEEINEASSRRQMRLRVDWYKIGPLHAEPSNQKQRKLSNEKHQKIEGKNTETWRSKVHTRPLSCSRGIYHCQILNFEGCSSSSMDLREMIFKNLQREFHTWWKFHVMSWAFESFISVRLCFSDVMLNQHIKVLTLYFTPTHVLSGVMWTENINKKFFIAFFASLFVFRKKRQLLHLFVHLSLSLCFSPWDIHRRYSGFHFSLLQFSFLQGISRNILKTFFASRFSLSWHTLKQATMFHSKTEWKSKQNEEEQDTLRLLEVTAVEDNLKSFLGQPVGCV